MSSNDLPPSDSIDVRQAAKAQLSVIAAERERRLKGDKPQEQPNQTDSAGTATPTRKVKLPPKKIAVATSQAWTDRERREYIRLIRDGHADRVEAMIRGVCREIEVGRKTDRFSDAASRLADEFEAAGQRFRNKKEVLTRIEERLDPLRRLAAEQAKVDRVELLDRDQRSPEKVGRLLEDTSTLRDELVDLTSYLLDLWDRLDEQVRADEQRERQLRANIIRAVENFPAKSRVNFELRLERALRGAKLQQRLNVLHKFEQALADATPEGRKRRKNKLLDEARIYLQAQDYPRAISILEKAHRLDSTDETVVLALAEAYEKGGQYERAIQLLETSLQSGETIPTLLALADVLEKAGRVDEALAVYNRAIALRPDDLRVRVAYCKALSRCGRTLEALEQLVQLHARHPRNKEVALALAQMCVAAGQLQKARDILEELVKDHPESVQAWVELADLYYDTRQIDDAVRAYRRVLELDRRLFQALVRLADIERGSGEFRAAEEHYRAAQQLDGDSCRVHVGLGIVLRETGRASDAVCELERAVAVSPEDGEIYHHLALACLLVGDYQRASSAMEQAVCYGFGDGSR